MLLGGLKEQYKTMYEQAMDVVKKNLLFRPMTPEGNDVLITGDMEAWETYAGRRTQLKPQGGHLACFAGGMLAMGGKSFGRKEDIELGSRLTDGCVWAYEVTNTGIMPELFMTIPCEDAKHCPGNQTLYDDAIDPTYSMRMESYQQRLEKAGFADDDDDASTDVAKRQVSADDAGDGKDSQSSSMGASTTWSSSAPVYTPPAPLSHEEYVKKRIEEDRIPPGIVSMRDKKYILRYVPCLFPSVRVAKTIGPPQARGDRIGLHHVPHHGRRVLAGEGVEDVHGGAHAYPHRSGQRGHPRRDQHRARGHRRDGILLAGRDAQVLLSAVQ